MLNHRAVYTSLLSTYLLAAGCSARVEEFEDEQNFLVCEIAVACGETRDCDVYFGASEGTGECYVLHRREANECIEQLEEHLAKVEEDPTTCGAYPSFPSCDAALELRSRESCQPQAIDGRPLLHDGHAVLPAIVNGHAWSEQRLEVGPADARSTAAAATYWLEAARTEHASVAAFSRVCLELLSVGAPPHLLEGCHHAALDEIRHARLALSVARAFGDDSWDLGPLCEVPSRPRTLREIAVDALVEGCIGEGTAAARAHVAADRARGPVAAVLRTIAEDETRHGALAWAIVRWAVLRDPSLADALQHALAQVRAGRRVPVAKTDPALAELGVMSTAEAARIECDVLETIVEPVLGKLLREVERGMLHSPSAGTTTRCAV